MVTISCAEGETGRVYAGALPIKSRKLTLSELTQPRTAIMVNLGNPELAFKTAMLPNSGVGLARMEFIISEHIKIHPMALVDPKRVSSAVERKKIEQLVRTTKSQGITSLKNSRRAWGPSPRRSTQSP